MNDSSASSGLPLVWLIGLGAAALLALWLAFKIAHIVIKLVCGLFVVAAIAFGVWWFLLRR